MFLAALLWPTLLILRERGSDNTDTVRQCQGIQTSEALVAGLGSGRPQIWPLDLSVRRHEQIHASSLVAGQLEQLNRYLVRPIHGAAMADTPKYSHPGLFHGPKLTLLALSP